MGKKVFGRKITIMELIEEIELQIWMYGSIGFNLVFLDGDDNQEYALEDLHLDYEDGIVIFYSSDNTVVGNVLISVLAEYIIAIYHSRVNGNMHEDILLINGSITIDSIAA